MAKKNTLTAIQQEFKKAIQNLRSRYSRSIDKGFLNEEIGQKIPDRITDEWVRSQKPRQRDIDRINKIRSNVIRTPEARELYEETYQDQLEPDYFPPVPEATERGIQQQEIINSYIDDVYQMIENRIADSGLGHKIGREAEYKRYQNIAEVKELLDSAIAHYGEDEINSFLSNPDVMQEISTVIDKIAVLYRSQQSAEANALVMRVATLLNNGPLSEEQATTLEETGLFDFSEDDLI